MDYLLSNTNGWVYYSDDNGVSWEPLPPEATSPLLTGTITVAFDPEFGTNQTVYAASGTADKGIYRIVTDQTSWERIDSSLPEGSIVSQVVTSADGTLYATNFKTGGGTERSLDPTSSSGPTFETISNGLEDNATLSGLWLTDNRLWSIDSYNNRVMTLKDSLTTPINLISPTNKSKGTGIKNIKLQWEAAEGATSYQWQFDYDTDFSNIDSEFEGETKTHSARLPTLELDTTYYWRVRASQPLLSPWSNTWAFTTSLGFEITAPQLLSPEPGATDVPLRPPFQWSAVANAESYELLVATNSSLDNHAIARIGDDALPGTAWQCDADLDDNATYYWKVRATNSDTVSDWSAVGVFTTEAETISPTNGTTRPFYPPPTSTPPPTPPPPAQPATPEWFIYMMGLMGLIVLLLLIILLILIVKIRQL